GDQRAVAQLLSVGAAYRLQNMVLANPSLVGTTLRVSAIASDDVDQLVKGHIAAGGRISAKQAAWVRALDEAGLIERRLNTTLFTNGDSREPELAGIWGAIVGSMLTMLVTLVLSFPLGVAAAVYLEEFAPKNRWTDLIEVNINNLAA